MRVITKVELVPGMVLGEDIVYQDKVLYTEDTTVDERMIARLKHYANMNITIKEQTDLISTHNEKVRFNERFKAFEKQYADCLTRCKGVMLSFLGTGQWIFDDVLLQIYNDACSKIANGSELLDFLYNMTPNEDELTYTQCLNSALLAGTFADWVSMSEEDKKILILCGFYYDIGKWKLPHDILWKPDKLTDEEYNMVKKHPVTGYALLRNNYNLNDHVKNAVIMHHERLDGSGYPYHMTGNKIDIFARYTAIIDTYVSMASPRAYRNAFTPLQILGDFEKSIPKYDIELLMPLMKRIADAQIGTSVQLNDDSVWEVMMLHPNRLSRPILRNDTNEFLDLLKHPEMEIVKNV